VARATVADGGSLIRAVQFLPRLLILLILTAPALALTGLLLASWFGIDVRSFLRFLTAVGALAMVVCAGLTAWVDARSTDDFGYHPSFALWCALLVAAAGIYLWMAAHWNQLRRRLLPLLLLTLAVPVLIEATIRATPMRWTWLGDYQGGYIRDQYLVRPIQGPLLWMTASGDYQARNREARPRDYPDQNPDALRIFCLGASSTFGSGVKEAEDAWPSVVERMIGDAVSDEVEVYNFGFPSLTSFDDLLFLERDLLALDPDWVVLSVTGNETICPHGNPPPQREQWESYHALTPLQRNVRRALLRTRMIVGLNQWLHHVTTPRDETHTVAQHPPDNYRATLERICDLAEEHGIDLMFIAEPVWERVVFDSSFHEPWRTTLAEVAAERGALFIDPAPAFAPHLTDEMWATWIHQTAIGNRVMAEAVAPALAAALGDPESGEVSSSTP
jgi:lysophospholipase L1-like esterase